MILEIYQYTQVIQYINGISCISETQTIIPLKPHKDNTMTGPVKRHAINVNHCLLQA